MPYEIVSGDFLWIRKKKNRLFLVIADCTGHGVPGAFLSILGIAFLNQVVDYIS
jgi:serine phosphatase RsbU (regulator of sigma subunit)